MNRGPDALYDRVTDIPLELLHAWQVQGVMLDLDNTLSPYAKQAFSDQTREWLNDAYGAGFRMMILSNGKQSRVTAAAQVLNLPAVHSAGKPRKSAFLKACAIISLPPKQCVMIGDQWITDAFGAQRAGLKTILVNPIDTNEFIGTRVNRVIESLWLKLMHLRRAERT